jgi:predicted DNA-binding transcriptional regulator AlpA
MAVILGLSVATIRRGHLQGKGPRFIKIGAAIRHPQEHVQSWLDTRSSGGETKAEVVQ